jgi:hypothetical protein
LGLLSRVDLEQENVERANNETNDFENFIVAVPQIKKPK